MNSSLEQTKKNLIVKSSIYDTSENILDNFDPQILDFIVILNHLGFSTFSSCQGHIDDVSYHSFYPFVMFCSKKAEKLPMITVVFEGRKDLIKEYKTVLKEQNRISDYLNEFYEYRDTPMKHRLIVKTCIFCRIIIEPYFSLFHKTVKSKKEQIRLNKIFLKEIDDFTEFLKTKI